VPRAAKPVDLSGVWLFSQCTKAQLRSIERKAKVRNAPAGTTVVHEGEVGTAFYFIVDGTATVSRRGRKVTDLGAGRYFGELSLLDQLPRNATVKAATDLTLVSISLKEFEALLKESPQTTRKLLAATATRLRSADPEPLTANAL
jgi:CRP-like cAMP-binding protein